MEVRLIALQDKLLGVDDLASILHPRVVAFEPNEAPELEVRNRAALPNQKRISIRRHFSGRLPTIEPFLTDQNSS